MCIHIKRVRGSNPGLDNLSQNNGLVLAPNQHTWVIAENLHNGWMLTDSCQQRHDSCNQFRTLSAQQHDQAILCDQREQPWRWRREKDRKRLTWPLTNLCTHPHTYIHTHTHKPTYLSMESSEHWQAMHIRVSSIEAMMSRCWFCNK